MRAPHRCTPKCRLNSEIIIYLLVYSPWKNTLDFSSQSDLFLFLFMKREDKGKNQICLFRKPVQDVQTYYANLSYFVQ